VTEIESLLLDAVNRLERHYQQRDEAMQRSLQRLTKRVNELAGQVEILQRQLQRLTSG
jgi:hypothetical protein